MNILVLCSNPVLGLGVIRCLGSAGHRVYAMGVGERPPYRFSRYCAGYVPFEAQRLLNANPRLTEQINRYCDHHVLELLIPCDLPTTLVLDGLRDQLQSRLFPISPALTVHLLHDKWRFAGFLTSNGLPHPRTLLIQRRKDLCGIDLVPPLMIKPRFGEGGQGIERVDDLLRLETIVRTGRGLPFLAQEYLPGQDVDISILASQGRIVAWTIQSPTQNPGRHEFRHEASVLAIAEKIVAASDYHGVAHIDMRIDERDGRPRVLEFNPRFWGTLTHSLWMGVNFPQLGIELVNNSLPPTIPSGPRGVCGTFDVRTYCLLKALLSRREPAGLPAECLAAWRMARADPVPELLGRFHGFRGAHHQRLAARRENIIRQLVPATESE